MAILGPIEVTHYGGLISLVSETCREPPQLPLAAFLAGRDSTADFELHALVSLISQPLNTKG